jgi:GH15 family glucan-1,4-alpha-glucosidase
LAGPEDVDRPNGEDMARYPSISDHGLIGDLQTAALVTTGGTVDWFCCPRFDSPSVFASLLDADKGGHFRPARRNGAPIPLPMVFGHEGAGQSNWVGLW